MAIPLHLHLGTVERRERERRFGDVQNLRVRAADAVENGERIVGHVTMLREWAT
jgi:hypothetical protein